MIDAYDISEDDAADLSETIRFHGHLCPGLAIGFRAAKTAMSRLKALRSEDEELIVIVENDSCSVDAVQWLTGCTFGKGNLFFRDYGKQVFTFALRSTEPAIRIALRSTAGMSVDESREARIRHLLESPTGGIFDIREAQISLPTRARIHETLICAACGEGVMSTRTREDSGAPLCIPCHESSEGKTSDT